MTTQRTYAVSDLRVSILSDLTKYVHYQDHNYWHEPKDAEGDAWHRAIFMTAGWPPTGNPAA